MTGMKNSDSTLVSSKMTLGLNRNVVSTRWFEVRAWLEITDEEPYKEMCSTLIRCQTFSEAIKYVNDYPDGNDLLIVACDLIRIGPRDTPDLSFLHHPSKLKE